VDAPRLAAADGDAGVARPKPRARPSFEGAVYLGFAGVFALSALALGENLVFLMGCFALCTGLAAWPVARRNLAGVEVLRILPSRVRAGVPVLVRYRLRTSSRRTALALEVEDHLGGAARPSVVLLEVAALEPARALAAEARVSFPRRGRLALGPLAIRSGHPLGAMEAEVVLPQPGTVLVRPREGEPTGILRARLGGSLDVARRPSLYERGEDAFHGVREWREGDDPRRIHWRTSARRGALAVAEWHREEGRETVVVLGRSAGVGAGDVAVFERAVSAAATVLRAAAREGLRPALRVGGASAARALSAALDLLAVVRPQGGRRPRAALAELAKNPRPRVVVFVASRPEPGVEDRLRAAAGRGGTGLFLRADRPEELRRWVRGLER